MAKIISGSILFKQLATFLDNFINYIKREEKWLELITDLGLSNFGIETTIYGYIRPEPCPS